MLKKRNRISKSRDFRVAFRGRAAENDFLKIRWRANNTRQTRFGFIVSKKISNKATQRNLIKRRLRSAAALVLNYIKEGLDIVIWPKPSLHQINFQTLQSVLHAVLQKNRLLK